MRDVLLTIFILKKIAPFFFFFFSLSFINSSSILYCIHNSPDDI